MDKKWLKKSLAVLIVAIMLVSIAGCNKTKQKKSETVERDTKEMVYEGSNFDIEGLEGEVSDVFVQNGKLYLSTYQYLEPDLSLFTGRNEEVDNLSDEKLEAYYEAMENSIMERLYSVNTDGTDLKEIVYPAKEDNQYIQDMAVDKDGNMAFLLYSYGKGTEDTLYQIVKTDEQGKELVREDITRLLKLSKESYIGKMLMSDKGRIVMSVDNAVYILDGNMRAVKEVKVENNFYIECMALTKDGQIVCGMSVWTEEATGAKIQVLDVDNEKWGEAYELDATYLAGSEALMNGVEYDVYYSDDSGIYGYSMVEKKATKILDFIASNITSDSSRGIKPLTKDQFIRTAFDVDYQTSLIVYNKVEPSTIKDKTVITIGSVWVDDIVKKKAIEFNKNSKEYQIEFVDYSNYDNPIAKINADIAAGNVPDILSLSLLPYEQYIVKGMFEDLTPYFENDDEVHTEDIIDSVYEAMKSKDGKLYYVSPSFNIATLITRTSDVGDGVGWTFNELKALLEKKGESARAFYSEDKVGMLYSFVMNGLDDFVDWNTGACSFDSHDFKDMLEICNRGTNEEMDYSGDSPSMSSLIQEGKVLFIEGWISFDEVQVYSKMYGEDITYIGYPNKEKQGSYFQFDCQMAICAKSEVKDGAWEFLRTFMTKEFQGKNGNLNNSPTRQDCMDMLIAAKMAVEEYTDELGQDVYPFSGSKSWDNFEVEVGPLSQEEVDTYINLVNNTVRVSASDDAMIEILEEEAKAYFAGEKGLDETVNIIQNRITTYVNENR